MAQMYKILVTTYITAEKSGVECCSVAAAIHTIMIEFNTQLEADTAYSKFRSDYRSKYTQDVKKLYRG